MIALPTVIEKDFAEAVKWIQYGDQRSIAKDTKVSPATVSLVKDRKVRNDRVIKAIIERGKKRQAEYNNM